MRMGGYDETFRRKEDYELWVRLPRAQFITIYRSLWFITALSNTRPKALPASVKVRLQNGRLMNCFFRAYFTFAYDNINS